MNNKNGVIWVTGLSASGKTTLTEMILGLLQQKGITPVVLDGDKIREAIDDPYWLYDEESRLVGSYRYSRLAKLFSDQGHLVLVPTISMFDEVRDWNRKHIENYFEVYISLSEQLRKERDKKGVYQINNLPQVVGQDASVQLPKTSDVNIENASSYDELKIQAQSVLTSFYNQQRD